MHAYELLLVCEQWSGELNSYNHYNINYVYIGSTCRSIEVIVIGRLRERDLEFNTDRDR